MLKTDKISKSFDGIRALDRVGIEAKKGLITLIIGPNGSGKTTLVNIISGFLKADEGKVLLQDRDITNKSPHDIYKLGLIRTFQIPQPLKRLTVLENLLIADENPGEGILGSLNLSWQEKESELSEKAIRHLEFLELDHLWNTESYKLSGGQLKLLEVGRALMRDIKIMIMDEPIAGINPSLAHSILELLTKLKKMGLTLLVVEHRLDIVLKYADNIFVMANGMIIAEGSEKEILENPEVVEVYLGASCSGA